MTQERERPTRADFNQALDQAMAPPPRSQAAVPQSSPSGRRYHPGVVLASVAILCGSLWMTWAGLRDPYSVDPEVLTADAITLVDVARLAVEEYWQREGTLPPDLAAVGLEELPVTYTPTADAFDVTAVDGDGDVIGYHGEEEAGR